MMKKYTTPIIIGILFGISALIYAVQFFVFHDSRDTFFYLLQDWAFLPVQIAVVTIAVGKLVESREKRTVWRKPRCWPVPSLAIVGCSCFGTCCPRSPIKRCCTPVCPYRRIGGIENSEGRFSPLKTAGLLFVFIRTV